MNDRAIEIQFDSNGEREDSYRPFSSVEATLIENELLKVFPDALNPAYGQAELISLHEEDDINYPDKTISVIYRGGPKQEFIDQFNIDIKKFSDCYGIKYMLNKKEILLKAYDDQMWHHRTPALPRGTRICEQFGIGVVYGDDNLRLNRDLYIIHDDKLEVQKFFGFTVDCQEFDCGRRGLFGLLYDARSLKVLKLKQYIYPGDPTLLDMEAH